MFDLGNQEIMKKYPNYKLYDYTSVRTISDINNPEGKMKWTRVFKNYDFRNQKRCKII